MRCGTSGTLTLRITVRPLPTTALLGQKVDVGGYRLYLECAGGGSPTIILEAGSAAVGGNFHEGDPGPGSATLRLEGWLTMRAALASETRVCAYDRAGIGWSDPGPEPRDTRQIAYELHTLLDNAGVANPMGNAVKNYYALADAAGRGAAYVPALSDFVAELNGVSLLPAIGKAAE